MGATSLLNVGPDPEGACAQAVVVAAATQIAAHSVAATRIRAIVSSKG